MLLHCVWIYLSYSHISSLSSNSKTRTSSTSENDVWMTRDIQIGFDILLVAHRIFNHNKTTRIRHFLLFETFCEQSRGGRIICFENIVGACSVGRFVGHLVLVECSELFLCLKVSGIWRVRKWFGWACLMGDSRWQELGTYSLFPVRGWPISFRQMLCSLMFL